MKSRQRKVAIFTIKAQLSLTENFTEDDAYDMILEQLPEGWEIDWHEVDYE